MIETVSQPRYLALGPLSSSPGSRAFLAVENGPSGPLWPLVVVWVPEEVERDPDRMKTLMEETARAVQIDHPNVNRVLGCEQLEEGWARVVEFADGETVRRVLQAVQRAGRPGLSPKIAARVLADVCRGTHHVHEMGQAEGSVRWRLHGAIKPETVIAGFDGVSKITGYGANAVAPRDAFGPHATLRSQYLSPEEIERGPALTDRRSDVYSLALVLYEAIAGKPPWSAEDAAFEYKVLNEPLPMEPLAPAGAALREAVAKALARVPADRFQTAALLADALEATGPATAAEVAADLSRLFPEDAPDRAARRQLLLTAGFVSHQLPRPSLRKREPAASASPPVPAPPAPGDAAGLAAMPASAPGGPTSAARIPSVPSRTATAKLPSRPQPAVAPPRRGVPPAAIVVASLGSAAVAALAVYLLSGGRPSLPAAAPPPPAAAVLPASPPQERAEPPVVTVPGAPQAPLADLTATPLTASAKGVDEPPLEPATLELASHPSMAVTIDGHPHGATPTKVEVPPGAHTIHFRDRASGVEEVRSVRVKPGAHLTVNVEVGRAGMEITAPPGSKILLDGKRVATAPTGALHFFAGHHVVKVVMGKAVFERPFDAEEGETLTLDVHPERAP